MANEHYLKIGSHNGFRWSAEKPLSEAMMAWFCDAYMCHSASMSHVSEHFFFTRQAIPAMRSVHDWPNTNFKLIDQSRDVFQRFVG